MTRIATERGVCSDQRKPILVLFDVLDGNLPSFHRVTVLAFGSHLAAMNVRVAIRARLTNLRENQFGVTLRAQSDGRMHPTQGVLGLVVIKVGSGADRLPTRAGVARLARKVETAVGTSCRGLILPLLARQRERRQQSCQQYNRPFHPQYAPFQPSFGDEGTCDAASPVLLSSLVSLISR